MCKENKKNKNIWQIANRNHYLRKGENTSLDGARMF